MLGGVEEQVNAGGDSYRGWENPDIRPMSIKLAGIG